jgi:hypothetical protein
MAAITTNSCKNAELPKISSGKIGHDDDRQAHERVCSGVPAACVTPIAANKMRSLHVGIEWLGGREGASAFVRVPVTEKIDEGKIHVAVRP